MLAWMRKDVARQTGQRLAQMHQADFIAQVYPGEPERVWMGKSINEMTHEELLAAFKVLFDQHMKAISPPFARVRKSI